MIGLTKCIKMIKICGKWNPYFDYKFFVSNFQNLNVTETLVSISFNMKFKRKLYRNKSDYYHI